MGNIKVLIVEDEPLYADQIEMLIDQLGYEHLATVDNSESALELMEQSPPDLILMDVRIQGDYDGIELTEQIHEKLLIPTIFITSLRDKLTFNRASRTQAVNFIVKPFNELQLQRAIELAVKKLVQPQTKNTEKEWEEDVLFKEHFFIKHRHRLEKVQLMDVLYFEADGHYCGLYLPQKKYLLRMSLSQLKERLPEERFLQTHRAYVVNREKIESIDLQENLLYFGKQHVPLSKRNKDAVLKSLDFI
ncbi:MAG: response regulator [Bacteroidota bacterium]